MVVKKVCVGEYVKNGRTLLLVLTLLAIPTTSVWSALVTLKTELSRDQAEVNETITYSIFVESKIPITNFQIVPPDVAEWKIISQETKIKVPKKNGEAVTYEAVAIYQCTPLSDLVETLPAFQLYINSFRANTKERSFHTVNKARSVWPSLNKTADNTQATTAVVTTAPPSKPIPPQAATAAPATAPSDPKNDLNLENMITPKNVPALTPQEPAQLIHYLSTLQAYQNQQVLSRVTYQALYFMDHQATPEIIRFPIYDEFWKVELIKPTLASLPIIQGSLIKERAEILRNAIYPLKKGHFEFPVIEFKVQLRDPLTHQTLDKIAKSQLTSLEVMPLPLDNQPPHFSGLVGIPNLKINSLDTEMIVGQPAVIVVQVSANANLSYLKDLDLSWPKEFQVINTQSNHKNDAWGLEEKTFQFQIIPQKLGTFILNPIRLSYFDPKEKIYRWAMSESMTLKVRANSIKENTASPTATKPSEAAISATSPSLFKNLIPSLSSIALFLSALAALISFYFSRRLWIPFFKGRTKWLSSKWEEYSHGLRQLRPKASVSASANLGTRLDQMLESSHWTQHELAHEISVEFKNFISEKLQIPSAHFTVEAVEKKLRQTSIKMSALEETLKIIHSLDSYAYGRSTKAISAKQWVQQIKKLAQQVEAAAAEIVAANKS